MSEVGEVPGLSRDELEALQLERLRATLRAAYDAVPHYRRAFDEAATERHFAALRRLLDRTL